MYADNLLGLTQNFLTPDIVNKFSSAIGETTEKTQKALKTVIPTLLLGIVNKGQTKDGAETLVNLVHKDGVESKKVTAYTDINFLSKGSDALNGIFGNNLESVVSELGDSTGIQSSGIKKMLGIATPLVMGFLESKIKREGMSTPGFMGFLGQQKSAISKLVPDGLVGRFAGSATSTPRVNKVVHKAGHLSPGTNRSPWITITIIALAILAALWWYTGSRTVSDVKPVTDSRISRTSEPVADIAAATYAAPTISQLNDFIKSGSTELPKAFRLEILTFKDDSTAIMAGSEAELDQIANSMKANPVVTARIDGYTDNVGSDIENLDLSLARAQAIKAELVSRGIAAGRLQTAGMGASKPLASNDQRLGRSQNNRIEFVVTRIE
jgi:OOP family OmpA-OmpF porin